MCMQSMELQRLGIENIPGQESARIVHLNPPEGAVHRTFGSNVVRTAKCGAQTMSATKIENCVRL